MNIHSKWVGAFFLMVGVTALYVLVMRFMPFGESMAGHPLDWLIPALKYVAFADLFTFLGVLFLSQAPDRMWSLGELFSLQWWQAEWVSQNFRFLLRLGVVFYLGAIAVDFVYKLTQASGLI